MPTISGETSILATVISGLFSANPIAAIQLYETKALKKHKIMAFIA